MAASITESSTQDTTYVKSTQSENDVDATYPVHMLDDAKMLRSMLLAWTLRFDDVLDGNKLHESLSRLLEIGDWRKIGGRLRRKVGPYSAIFRQRNHVADFDALGERKIGDTCAATVFRRPSRRALQPQTVPYTY